MFTQKKNERLGGGEEYSIEMQHYNKVYRINNSDYKYMGRDSNDNHQLYSQTSEKYIYLNDNEIR